jgi:hypothetical protein
MTTLTVKAEATTFITDPITDELITPRIEPKADGDNDSEGTDSDDE